MSEDRGRESAAAALLSLFFTRKHLHSRVVCSPRDWRQGQRASTAALLPPSSSCVCVSAAQLFALTLGAVPVSHEYDDGCLHSFEARNQLFTTFSVPFSSHSTRFSTAHATTAAAAAATVADSLIHGVTDAAAREKETKKVTASNSRAKTPGDTKKTPSLSRPHPLECLANGSPGQEPPSLLKRETKAGEREIVRDCCCANKGAGIKKHFCCKKKGEGKSAEILSPALHLSFNPFLSSSSRHRYRRSQA